MCNTSHITSSRLSNKPGYNSDRYTYPTLYPRLPAAGRTNHCYFDIPNTLKYIYMMSYFFQVNYYPVSNSDLSLPLLPCTKMPAYISVYSVNYFLTISIVNLSNLSNKNTLIALECVCSTSFPLYIQFIYPLCMLLV